MPLKFTVLPTGLPPNINDNEYVNSSEGLVSEQLKFGKVFMVGFRASVVRLVFYKLLGTGVVAALVGVSSGTGPDLAFSCALSVGVNAIATYHYHHIWAVRAQRIPEAEAFTRGGGGDQGAKVFLQEYLVDSYRFTDWLCTMLLLQIELGATREFVVKEVPGTPKPVIIKEWAAFLQVCMVTLGGVYRFVTNEARDNTKTSCKSKTLGWIAFVLSSVCFVLAILSLQVGLKSPYEYDDPDVHRAVMQLFVFPLIWVGYPLVMLVARVWLRHLDPERYSEGCSLFKDVAFGTLDVLSKAGLALFVALRAHAQSS